MLPAARFRSVVLLAPFACHPGFDRRRSNLPAASVKIGGAAVAAPTGDMDWGVSAFPGGSSASVYYCRV
jgi:hypothetical protein